MTFIPLQVGGGVMFRLWVKAELEEEELLLLKKYDLTKALLIDDDWLATLRKAIRAALILGFVLWWLLFLVLSWSMSTTLTLFAMIAYTAFYYNEVRERIYVRDLVHGRTFRCFSIIELVKKEDRLKDLALALRQVLESAKYWDGREVVEIPALVPEDAKALVARL